MFCPGEFSAALTVPERTVLVRNDLIRALVAEQFGFGRQSQNHFPFTFESFYLQEFKIQTVGRNKKGWTKNGYQLINGLSWQKERSDKELDKLFWVTQLGQNHVSHFLIQLASHTLFFKDFNFCVFVGLCVGMSM